MAETTKQAAAKKTVAYMLPIDKSPKASQEVYVSVNFKNYILRRGVKLEIPVEVAEVLDRANEAEIEAMAYSDEQIAKSDKEIR